MRNLWMRLAPPSVDVSGAESVLFGLGGRLLVYDNQGCVGGVVRVDERRWAEAPQDMESARLSEVDIELGRNDRLVEQALAESEGSGGRRPTFIALLGGPVSACVGTDLQALAHTIGRRSGLPALCIETNGHDWYDRGVSKALAALYSQWGRPAASRPHALTVEGRERVNVLGAVLLDMERTDWLDALERDLERGGFELNAVLGGMRPDGEALARMGDADVNLVVNAAALALARTMEEELGIPYAVGLPMGARSCERLRTRLRSAAHGGPGGVEGPGAAARGGPAVLLVGEQVAMNGLRELLEDKGVAGRVDVATFFAFDRRIARTGDRRLADEAGLREVLGQGYACAVADNLVERVLADVPSPHPRFVALPHAPLSGRRFLDQIPALVGPEPDSGFMARVAAAAWGGKR